MRRLLPFLFLGAPGLAYGQATPIPAQLVQPARCALADTLLGPRAAKAKAVLQAVYVPDRDESLIFTRAPSSIPSVSGIRYTTGMVRLPGRATVPEPTLELTLRIFSDQEREPGTQWLQLVADDSVIGDSLPLALRRQPAPGVRRTYQTATIPLTHNQSIALVRAERISGDLSGTHFRLGDREQNDLRAMVIVGLCGASKPW